MVLVAGTDFSAPGYEDNTYVGFDETTQEGLSNGSFETSVLRIDKDPKADGVAWDYKTGASDFHDSPHYAVTNNPIKLDSAAYMDMGEKNWYMVFSTPNALSKEPLFKYSANGFRAGSPVSVAIKFCRLIDTDGKIVGQKESNGGICQYEPLQGKVRVNQNFSSENIHKDKDLNIDKTGGCQEVVVSTVASASGEVIVDFVPQANSSCCAYFIDYIYIYGSIDPKVIAPESEVCAGGERLVLSLDRVYRDVKYQWYKGNSAISGATEPSYSHESGNDTGVKTTYYCEITTSSGSKIKSKNFTVIDKASMPSVLVEYAFYSNLDDLKILKNNRSELVEATVKAICQYFGIEYKKEITTNTNKLYKVCIGAYKNKDNADKILKEAKEKGFKNSYIIYE
jgi:hypothetical protein